MTIKYIKLKEKIKYRRAQPEEAQKYRVLRLESLQKYPMSFGSRFEQQQQQAKLSFEKLIEEAHPEKFIIGAFHREQLIGICGFARFADERCRHRGEIIQMYVQPNYQGKNIGFHLLKTSINEAFKISDLEQIELEVISKLTTANRIYQKAGFQECGLKRNFYKQNGEYFDLKTMVLYRNEIV